MKKLFLLFFLITLFSGSSLSAQSLKIVPFDNYQSRPTSYTNIDLDQYPEKIETKNNLEKIFSIPGKIVYFPLWLLLEITGETIQFVDETHIVPKIIDYLTTDDGRIGLRPMFAPRAGGGVNLFFKDLIHSGTKLTFTAARGMRNRQKYQAEFKNVEIRDTGINSRYKLSYQFLSDEAFFGLGNNSLYEEESNFALETVDFEANFSKAIHDKFGILFQIGYEQNQVFRGKDKTTPSTTDLYSPGILSGLHEKVKLGRMALDLQFDTRNRLVQTSSGGVVKFSSSVYSEFGGDEFGFYKFNTELQQYFNLFYNRILLFRIAGEITEAMSGRKVPFYHFSELGRQETIRGYMRGRFRSGDYMLGSVEYRYPVYNLIDAMLFIDAGKVSPNIFDDFSGDDMHIGYGGGFNIWGEEGIAVQLLFGKSKEDSRFYLNMNKSIK